MRPSISSRSARLAIAVGAVLFALPGLPALAHAQAANAYSLSDIVDLVKNKVPSKRVLALAKENCVSFSFDDDAKSKLRRAGASTSLITELSSVCGPDNPKPTAADSAKAAPPPAPVAVAPPPDTTFPVKIRVAVVGADLTVRPVPQMDLYVIGPQGDTTRMSTDLDGSAGGSFKDGVYRVESARSVTIGNERYRWAFYQTFAKDMRAIELTQKNAMIDTIAAAAAPAATTTPAGAASTSAPAASTGADSAQPAATAGPTDSAAAPKTPAKPVRHENVERDIFDKYKSGVFTVFGAARGTGFLVDSSGLVVTNAHLIKGADEVRVQIDSATKVYAKPLVTDDAKDIAVLAINMSHCSACAVLPLFDSSKSTAPVAGDRVLALGSPINRLSVLSIGIVSSADDHAVVSDAGVNWLNTGGPLINLDGYVVALNSTRESQLALADVSAGPRVASSVPVASVADAVQRARTALSSLGANAPTDSLLPVLPPDPFPKAPIDAVSALPRLDLDVYRTGGGPFRVLVMTPQVMAWRQVQADKALAARKHDDPRKAAQWRRIDPIEGWRDWRDYLDDRRAVVVVNVMPEAAAFPFYDADKIQSIDAGDFKSMVITRDGVPIVPVEKVRIPAVLNVDEMRASGRQIPMQGIYVYRIRDFAPRAVGTTATYAVRIVDAAQPDKPVTIPVQPALIEQLWKDFTPYRFP
ncbi:MAG TPA: trypsin-like peptidase domain-containing protein [Gemmatimonadaceae bacterium]|nr:trypsin-like peptidase domain-containing protein [Gemmatimonadaceae bacterium]